MEANEKLQNKRPTFDCRIFPINNKLVGSMFLLCILSCYKNCVNEFHDYFFGAKAGFKLTCNDKKNIF